MRSFRLESTWGVDYALVDGNRSLVSLCYHYRDGRTDGLIEEVSALLGGKERVFEETGIAFQPFSTIYQLVAHKRDGEVFAAQRSTIWPCRICLPTG